MKTILNKTPRPLKVPLPRGKVLHLGPKKSGEIADGAADHAPLAKLVEAGELEILGHGISTDPGRPSSGPVHASTHGHHPASNSHNRGDR